MFYNYYLYYSLATLQYIYVLREYCNFNRKNRRKYCHLERSTWYRHAAISRGGGDVRQRSRTTNWHDRRGPLWRGARADSTTRRQVETCTTTVQSSTVVRELTTPFDYNIIILYFNKCYCRRYCYYYLLYQSSAVVLGRSRVKVFFSKCIRINSRVEHAYRLNNISSIL